MSLLILLRTAEAGPPVFPPLPPAYPVAALPGGEGGRRAQAAPALRASAGFALAVRAFPRRRSPEKAT